MTDVPTIIVIICFIEWGLIHIAAGCLTCFPMGGAGGGACTAGPAAGGLVPIALIKALSEEKKDAFKAVKCVGHQDHHQPRPPAPPPPQIAPPPPPSVPATAAAATAPKYCANSSAALLTATPTTPTTS